jgi:hypothetical protein
VIVGALGPTLSQFGVTNVLADPTLELHDNNGTFIASNDNWADIQQAQIQTSGYAPPNALESAIIIVRPADNSTAVVRGKNNTAGNALVEVYTLSPWAIRLLLGPKKQGYNHGSTITYRRFSAKLDLQFLSEVGNPQSHYDDTRFSRSYSRWNRNVYLEFHRS